jgi:aspartate kinase
MIVMKFGGSSVESAAAIERVARIVAGKLRQRPVVVVSAMDRTTDRLVELSEWAAAGRRQKVRDGLAALQQFHLRESSGLEAVLDRHFDELRELLDGMGILGELTPRARDAIMSYGERLSSLIVARAFEQQGLPAVYVDARRCLVTDETHTKAAPLLALTRRRLRARVLPLLAKGRVPVLGGFIGATRQGVTTTLGRGGSDYSAALFGAALHAKRIEIWTDVDGVLTADPRILRGVHRVKFISFEEAAELAYFGAKVLHPATILPAVEQNIPVQVLNSRRPELSGTSITSRAPKTTMFKAIACKRNITLVDITSTRMLMAYGFLARIFQVFAAHQTPVDMIATTEVSVSLTLDDTRHLPVIVQELRKIATVNVSNNKSIICLVGDSVRPTPGISGQVFQTIRKINVIMISQGPSERNLSFVIADADVPEAVRLLHRRFFARPDKKVFATV